MNEKLVNKVIIKFPLIREGFQFSFAWFLKVNFNSIKKFNWAESAKGDVKRLTELKALRKQNNNKLFFFFFIFIDLCIFLCVCLKNSREQIMRAFNSANKQGIYFNSRQLPTCSSSYYLFFGLNFQFKICFIRWGKNNTGMNLNIKCFNINFPFGKQIHTRVCVGGEIVYFCSLISTTFFFIENAKKLESEFFINSFFYFFKFILFFHSAENPGNGILFFIFSSFSGLRDRHDKF